MNAARILQDLDRKANDLLHQQAKLGGYMEERAVKIAFAPFRSDIELPADMTPRERELLAVRTQMKVLMDSSKKP